MSAHQLGVDNFEPGRTTRDTINANARSRSRQAGPSNPASPNALAWAYTAARCPCGKDRSMVTAASARTSCSPFRPASIQSMTWLGSAERFATVSFFTLPSARKVLRR